MADVDNSPWDGPAAMSNAAQSDDPAVAYEAICAGRRDGDPSLQSTWALPHHATPGDPPNAAGVRNSLSRLPQTDGLTNREAAQRHLEAHLASIQQAAQRSDDDEVQVIDAEPVIQVRDAQRRELDIRIVPWDTVIHHDLGPEMFVRGAFREVDPSRVILKAPDAEGKHHGPPVGKGMGKAVEERDDGAYMTFRVSRTQAGDDLITLAQDGVVTGASVGYLELAGGHRIQTVNGKRVRVQERVGLDHVVTTWRPAYERAAIVAMRSEQTGDLAPMAETTVAPAEGAVTPTPQTVTAASDERMEALFQRFADRQAENFDRLSDAVKKIEERNRQDITIPVKQAVVDPKMRAIDWTDWALRTLVGEKVGSREVHERALDDIITPDNPGVVPDAVINDIIGIINQRRPFLQSTRQIVAPDTGMSIVVPVLSQRSTAAVQANEKTEIESTALKVTNQSFDAVTIAGGADVSIQMIRRAQRSYIDLLLSDLGYAYAQEADSEALTALFTAGTTPGSANLDPEDLNIGEAWANSINNFGEPPDTIWMSADGVAAFIDAKSDGTNAPLYFTLRAGFGAGNAPSGDVSALRPVYVPALNGTSVDVMIGPSQGFAWAEDGTFTLTADNPTKAGRDIALVGILFFIPRYPAAFTTYDLGS